MQIEHAHMQTFNKNPPAFTALLNEGHTCGCLYCAHGEQKGMVEVH